MKTNTIFYKKRATILACATLAIPRFATESIAQTTNFISPKVRNKAYENKQKQRKDSYNTKVNLMPVAIPTSKT